MGIVREILLRGSESRWLADQLTRRRFTRRAVERFLPGEDLNAALDATAGLEQRGIPTILTLLGEHVSQAAEAEAAARHYLEVLARVSELKLDSDISLKPTQLGIDLDLDGTYERYKTLIRRAGELGRTVAIDMEESSYVDRTIDLYRRLRADHPNVVLCLQAYLYRTASDLAVLLPIAPHIRLVKGAYNEPATLAFHRKRDVDANFLKLADTLLEELSKGTGVQLFLGTHDPRMIYEICRRAEELKVPKDAFEFQLLYGIQRELQTRLADDGYRVRVLISYGDAWFPWYMRRLAERPANILFLLRNLFAA
ncbi:MAG: proline dehydrogenase family protein [Gemmatimonadota bacterium]|nr:MAG: proline dehydrogenase family protein [Gemmatimonadota bacterium]